MKRTINVIAAAWLAAMGAVALAQSADKKTPAAAPAATDLEQQFAGMQSQMDRIAATRDPEERQRLMQEHLAAMQKLMASMDGAHGGMMGCCGTGAAADGHMMMNGCMPMRRMMDQMMQHQHWMMQSPPPSPPAKKK